MATHRFITRTRLLGLAASSVLMLGACRQILGLDETLPELPPAGGGADDAGTGGAADADAGSPFQVVHAVPQGEVLVAIWGASPHFQVAVGSSLTSFVIVDGVTTRLGGNEKGHDYLGVWGFAPDDVFAVGQVQLGGTGFVYHFDGSTWTQVFDAPVALTAAWGGVYKGQQVVLATGVKGRLFGWHTDSSWTALDQLPSGPYDPDTPDAPIFRGISGRSFDDYSMVSDGRFWHYEPDPDAGTAVFAYYDLTTSTNTRFHAVWQASDPPGSAYLGTNFNGLGWFYKSTLVILHRDESFVGADKAFVQGVWGTPERVVAVGDHGWIFAYDLGTSTGAPVASPTDEALGAVWGSSLDDVWIVGARELILHGSVR